jgi:hypothetical protein
MEDFETVISERSIRLLPHEKKSRDYHDQEHLGLFYGATGGEASAE